MGIELYNWKKRRSDPRVENYWKKIASQRKLNGHEEYQQKWNFIETEYGHRPSSNGLDLMNPGFAFHTSLVKYMK